MDAPYTLAALAALLRPHMAVELTGDAKVAEAPLQTFLYDSRTLVSAEGTVFLALTGSRRDGHAFIEPLYARGVRCFWVQKPQELPGAAFLVVPDVLAALQQVAALHRAAYTGTVVGITGSNGKTIVKEWLAQLLEGQMVVYKSPRSYNSQLGVPLALLGLRRHHSVALVECGISQVGEMEKLAALVQPDVGILTHMGTAHADGFPSPKDKVAEKLRLFAGVKTLISHGHNAAFAPLVEAGLKGIRARVIRPAATASETEGGTALNVALGGEQLAIHTPLTGPAHVENLALVATAALHLGVAAATLRERLPQLAPLELRTELITGNPDVAVLSDAYNADADSFANALALLQAAAPAGKRRIILSDLEAQGRAAPAQHRAVLAQLMAVLPEAAIELIGPRFTALAPPGVQTYPSVTAFLLGFRYSRYVGTTVLVKGARRFGLEALLPHLTQHPGPTVLQINLDAARRNLRTLQARVPNAELLVMLKAGAYGAGGWQMAQALTSEPLAGFAVAQAVEGIELRQRGIDRRIVVLYPDPTLALCHAHGLEPVVSGWAQLAALAGLGRPLAIHLEVDTGMGRLGFAPSELPQVVHRLQALPDVRVESCFAHLAASEDPAADAFTEQQLVAFEAAAGVVRGAFPAAKRHVLNTGGLLRFPAHAFEWVRVGIGLFGIDPRSTETPDLEEVASLHTAIAQLHHYPAGTSVGYGRAEVLARDSVIATLPLGYADGFPRAAGERASQVLIRETLAPVVGRVCMDLLMVDVTDVPGVTEGDAVVVFGRQGAAFQSIHALAQAAGTIPYEVLSRIPTRVRRSYLSE